jgi:hypothetical protein
MEVIDRRFRSADQMTESQHTTHPDGSMSRVRAHEVLSNY